MAGHGKARHGEARNLVWRGPAGRGKAGQGKERGSAGRGMAWHGVARLGMERGLAWFGLARRGQAWRGSAGQGMDQGECSERYKGKQHMTDTQLLDWLELTGASVVAGTGDTLLPESYSVCVNRITGWQTRQTLRDAIKAAELEYRTTTGERMT